MEVICEDNCGYVLGQQNLREGRTRKKRKKQQQQQWEEIGQVSSK